MPNTEYKEIKTSRKFLPRKHKETTEWGIKNRFSG